MIAVPYSVLFVKLHNKSAVYRPYSLVL